jgi:hypothetical protein
MILKRRGEYKHSRKIDEAIHELAEARTQKRLAEDITVKLERDRRQNHYADMVRRALWQPRQ